MSDKQLKARYRSQLFWYIKGLNLKNLVDTAVQVNALSSEEKDRLITAVQQIEIVKNNYFENTKKIGLNPKRRCKYCGKVAKYKTTYFNNNTFACKHCIEELFDIDVEYDKAKVDKFEITKIDPNK